jgi:AraC-like DNA-binding protein
MEDCIAGMDFHTFRMAPNWPPVASASPVSPDTRMAILPSDIIAHAETLPLCRMLTVTHIGRFERLKGHTTTRPQGAAQHVLLLCFDGAGRVEMNTGTWTLGRDHVVYFSPGEPHHDEADSSNPWPHCWFHFIGRNAAECAGALDTTPANPILWVEDADSLLEAFEDSFRYVLGGYTDADLIGLSASCMHFLGLCRTLQRADCPRQRHGEERILKSIRFMRRNTHRALLLADIAREVGLSVTHYSAMFRRQTRCGPIEFFNRLKIQRACEQLILSSQSVSEIAYSLGFEDPLYFSRCFRRHIGIPPSEYRASSEREKTDI